MHRIQLALSAAGARLLRNNVGVAWQGRAVRLDSGDVLIKAAQRVRYGVGNPGGSDLVGFHTVTVTPDMVGRRVALALAVEIKVPGGVPTTEQARFLRAVQAAGGIAFAATSVTQAEYQLADAVARLCGPGTNAPRAG